jgi:hypothetical protein
LGEAIGLPGHVMKGLGQVLDDEAVMAGEVFVFVDRDLPARHERVEAIENRQVEDRMKRLEERLGRGIDE